MEFFTFIGEQWLLVSIFMLLLYTFAWRERAKGGSPITQNELVRLMNAGEAALLDVRPTADFQNGHIHGALNIPHNNIASRVTELEKHRNQLIVLVDKLGQHAGAAGKVLSKEGYNVRRLTGGMTEWQNQSMPLVKGKQ